MPDVQGYSFSPGLQQRFRGALSGQPNQISPNTSQALQVLSLHLPSFIGGAPIAPDALLRAGGQVRPDTAVRAATTGTPAPAPPLPPAPAAAAPSPTGSPLSVSAPSVGGPTPGPDIRSLLSAITGAPAPAPSAVAAPSDTGPAGGSGPAASPGFIYRNPRPDGGGSSLSDLMGSLFGGGGAADRQQI
jgi:hypothetical protein